MKNFLQQLYADNKAAPKSFTVTNTAESARIDLFDIIDDDYGISAAAFVTALNSINAGNIELHINSPGGSVSTARTMVAAIAAHPAHIDAYVDGFAFSAASWLAMACNSVAMQAGAMMMVHKSSGLAFGNADDMMEMAGILEKLDETIVADYVRKTGRPADEMKAMMSPPTFMTAAEAVANKFADRVIENEKGKAPGNIWNLAAYGNVPAALSASTRHATSSRSKIDRAKAAIVAATRSIANAMSNDTMACIEACAECAAACEYCAAECLASSDAGTMAECIQSCNECANLCRATATATAQGSAGMADMCALCATSAAACAIACAKHTDMECCVECADDCADCQAQCTNMAAMGNASAMNRAAPVTPRKQANTNRLALLQAL